MTPAEDSLTAYMSRPKFDDPAAWLDRGLNPSSSDVQARMEAVVDAVAQSTLAAVQSGGGSTQVKRAIVRPLGVVKASEFDTEEREWICAEVAKISKFANVSVNAELNKWLYGRFLGTVLQASALLRQEPATLATYSAECGSCTNRFSSLVTETSPSIPDAGWFICSCTNCGYLNLLRVGAHIKATRSDGCKFVRQLRLEDHTQESAEAELTAMRTAKSGIGSRSAP